MSQIGLHRLIQDYKFRWTFTVACRVTIIDLLIAVIVLQRVDLAVGVTAVDVTVTHEVIAVGHGRRGVATGAASTALAGTAMTDPHVNTRATIDIARTAASHHLNQRTSKNSSSRSCLAQCHSRQYLQPQQLQLHLLQAWLCQLFLLHLLPLYQLLP